MPTPEQIASAARLVPEQMAEEFGPGYVWNEYKDDARPWQPWADTEAGRSDAFVLLAAVMQWLDSTHGAPSDEMLDVASAVHDALLSGNVQQIQQTAFAAAVAIGEYLRAEQ